MNHVAPIQARPRIGDAVRHVAPPNHKALVAQLIKPHPKEVDFRSRTSDYDASYVVQARYIIGETRFYGRVSGSMDSLSHSKFITLRERGRDEHWLAYERLCESIDAHRAAIEPIDSH